MASYASCRCNWECSEFRTFLCRLWCCCSSRHIVGQKRRENRRWLKGRDVVPVRFILCFLYQSDTQNCRLASEGNLKAISVFVMAGGDVNEADYDGRTALHLATGSRCQFVFCEFYLALLRVYHICESLDVLNLIQVLQTKSSMKSPSSCSKRAPNDFPIVGAIRLSRVIQSMVWFFASWNLHFLMNISMQFTVRFKWLEYFTVGELVLQAWKINDK